MSTRADWIRIELSGADVAVAKRRALLRQKYAEGRPFKAKGLGSLTTHTIGCLGEAAVARYCGVDLDPDWTWEADVRRGHDVGGWQVRCRKSVYALWLNPGDQGPHLLVMAHQAPVMHLVGWLDAGEGLALGRAGTVNGHSYVEVAPKHLRALPAQNGYTPAVTR